MPIQKGLDPIVTGTMMKRLQITGLLAWYVEMSLTSKKIEEVSPLHSKWALVGYSGGSPHTVQKLIVISNKFPRSFDSIFLSYVIDAY